MASCIVIHGVLAGQPSFQSLLLFARILDSDHSAEKKTARMLPPNRRLLSDALGLQLRRAHRAAKPGR